ncbi:hypothetical protein CONPUDRAFT_125628 [Coniophora puteana RWD-64-598 SS2]|uniref:MYND-type domain-containing protein n=1 Tax=Coniophora puteana (strain RWD-64-598) TaxID=741705 RepID=A0A5M3MQ12_CONPW|nr:uncharacterized protein CONPUDRAFT_125628 [Coniophora puteana RWD-64-598 SS2]EIW80765.1 hypothetical protein CONPUDRAFT_125628 [Coniophora puteana RWD-64-598 SS2]
MSHTIHWPGKTFFYPIGNTSPVSLTQDLPVGTPDNILLLGCGDPRSILHTVHMSANGSHLDRSLDFTCVDVEGAVLARNVVLVTLLGEQTNIEEKLPLMWNIFFDFLIDQSSLSLLVTHCAKLLATSASLEDWKRSSYSRHVSFCDANTLSVVRKYWRLYLRSATLTKTERVQFKVMTISGMKTIQGERIPTAPPNLNYWAARSAGPLAPHVVRIVTRGFRRFWETGVTAYDAETVATAQLVNPTFVHSMSGDKFSVHHLSYPLTSFHLSDSFISVDLQNTDRWSRVRAEKYEDDLMLNVVIPAARRQFSLWCTSLFAILPPSSVQFVVRLFCGDALSFCKALRYYCDTKSATTPFLTAPWKTTCITFDSQSSTALQPLPTAFDVVDTSNLSDDLGLLNILVHAGSLLQRASRFGVLYTETLLPEGQDVPKGLLKYTCCDLGTLSLLLGLVPTAFVSGFTTHSNLYEVSVCQTLQMLEQYHERLVWRRPMPGDVKAEFVPGRSVFAHGELARAFYHIYLKMFADEDMSAKYKDFWSSYTGAFTVMTHRIHYVRRTFAELLDAVHASSRAHATADWTRVMRELIELIKTDRTLFTVTGSNYLQDLCCHLHLLGVHTVDWIEPSEVAYKIRTGMGGDVYRDWRIIPVTVWIVLTVPRSHLRAIEGELDKQGAPILQCEVFGRMASHTFPSIDVTFGKVVVAEAADTTDKGDKTVLIVEDEKGRGGSSDIVAAFQAPASILTVEPQMSVALVVRSTPHSSTPTLISKIGFLQRIFSGRVDDERHVHVLRSSPFTTSSLTDGQSVTSSGAADRKETNPRETDSSVNISMNHKHEEVSSLTARVDVVENGARSSLAQGASVVMEPATPCSVHVSWKGHAQVHVFPLPVDFDRARLRIARKSSYIEVLAPVSTTVTTRNMRFPVFLTEQGHALWNVHRVVLDKLPSLKPSGAVRSRIAQWLNPHVDFGLSDPGRGVSKGQQQPESGVRKSTITLKQTLHDILLGAAGIRGPAAPCVKGLDCPDFGCYMLIFISELRLDPASHTVVADSWVVPLNGDITSHFAPALRALSPDIDRIVTEPGTMELWKHLLPAVTERCRTWTHHAECEYQQSAAIPLTLKVDGIPICSCGRGMGTAEVSSFCSGPWKAFAPYATRAALSPLFSVSYLENEGRMLRDEKLDSSPLCAACGGPGRPSLLMCGRCRTTTYCSMECQRKDWKSHKAACK